MIVVLDFALSSVFGTADSLVASVSTVQFLMCCAASIVLGAAVACIYMFRHKYSKNFVVTLALLPLIVQMVITLVNGNLGAGIAVMGVFNLVRFRSIPGSAKDIGSVFLAMAIGLATGMGFIALAVLFTFIVGVVNVVTWIKNFIIGLIVSVYLLASRKKFGQQGKLILYSLVKSKISAKKC